MATGWEFRFRDRVYYVGARDLKTAQHLVLQHLQSEGDVQPRQIPPGAMAFLGLKDGTLIEARVFSATENEDAFSESAAISSPKG